MNITKRNQKESLIINAAELIFNRVGYQNAKMEDIASEASITKVTLYSYFQSKDNLYLAICYRAVQKLIDDFYDAINEEKQNSGLDRVVAIFQKFMDYCESNYLYSEAMLHFFNIIRSTSQGTEQERMTDGIKESIYFRRTQDIQNLPFTLTVRELKSGISDGSILPEIDPMLFTLSAWTMALGYIKVIASSGDASVPLFSVSLKNLKSLNLMIAKHILTNPGFLQEYLALNQPTTN